MSGMDLRIGYYNPSYAPTHSVADARYGPTHWRVPSPLRGETECACRWCQTGMMPYLPSPRPGVAAVFWFHAQCCTELRSIMYKCRSVIYW
eukprot:1528326-Rhodomonas_salina.1